MIKVTISEHARAFLREEMRYLRRHSTAAAQRLKTRLDEAISNLSRFPDTGAKGERAPVPGVRRLVIGDYILDYEIHDENVSIMSIRHGRMKPEISEPEDDHDYESDNSSRPRR